MKIIVGLGNPGKQYEKTRHNVGFMVLDAVSRHYKEPIASSKFNSLIAEFFVNGEKIILVKPQTYMNLSGNAVEAILNYYQASEEDLFVIYDDLDLEVGSLRLREKGSSGGQNGIKHIIAKLDTQAIKRLRIGIGNNKRIPTADYVLGKYDEAHTPIDKAKECVIDYIEGMSFNVLATHYNIV